MYLQTYLKIFIKSILLQLYKFTEQRFFESNGTFINTEGCFKKVVKFLPSVKQSKEDWQILRKIFSYSKK